MNPASLPEKVFALMLLMLLPAAALHAQARRTKSAAVPFTSQPDPAGRPSPTGVPRPPLYVRHSADGVGTQYRIFDSLPNALSHASFAQEPLAYDAATNRLMSIKLGNAGLSGEVFFRYSDDRGYSWSEPDQAFPAGIPQPLWNPSITILNPGNSHDVLALDYGITVLSGPADGATRVLYQQIIQGNSVPLSPPDSSTGADAGGHTLSWWGDVKSLGSADGTLFITAGEIEGNNIGMTSFDRTTRTLTTSIPQQWDASHYVDPVVTNIQATLLAGFGMDRTGSIYAGIYSRFPEREIMRRAHPYPAVSMSTDNGRRWRELNLLPVSPLQQYALSQEANPDSVHFSYGWANDFIVTGNGNFSFFLDLFESNNDKTPEAELRQLVEVYKVNGIWGIRKVADISGRLISYDPMEPAEPRISLLGSEVQAARTPDGTGLLVKWIDLVTYILDEDLNRDGVTPDTVISTDVFVAARRIVPDTSDHTWSRALNITGTPVLDRFTRIPETIPDDYMNIPLMTLQTKIDPKLDLTREDELINAQVNVAGRMQYMMMSNFDAGSIAAAEPGAATRGAGMMLSPAFPNPASTAATIRLTLSRRADVRLHLRNTLGELVCSLADGTMEAGDHEIRVATGDLPAGSYYLTSSSGNETMARMFVVVR